MSEPTEAEVEAASRALTERGVIIPRGYLRLALTAAAQVRAREKAKNCKHPRMRGTGSLGTDGSSHSTWSCPDCYASGEMKPPPRGERDPPIEKGRDHVAKILRFFASEPYVDSSTETVLVSAVLLTTAAAEIERLRAALEDIAGLPDVRWDEGPTRARNTLNDGTAPSPTPNEPGPVLTGWGPKSSAVLGDRKEQGR
jgi:hypothetical protein